jgi:hypothetical protein
VLLLADEVVEFSRNGLFFCSRRTRPAANQTAILRTGNKLSLSQNGRFRENTRNSAKRWEHLAPTLLLLGLKKKHSLRRDTRLTFRGQ